MDEIDRLRIEHLAANGPTEDVRRELLYGLASLNDKVDTMNGTLKQHGTWIDMLRLWQAESKGQIKSVDSLWVKGAAVSAVLAAIAAVVVAIVGAQ